MQRTAWRPCHPLKLICKERQESYRTNELPGGLRATWTILMIAHDASRLKGLVNYFDPRGWALQVHCTRRTEQPVIDPDPTSAICCSLYTLQVLLKRCFPVENGKWKTSSLSMEDNIHPKTHANNHRWFEPLIYSVLVVVQHATVCSYIQKVLTS